MVSAPIQKAYDLAYLRSIVSFGVYACIAYHASRKARKSRLGLVSRCLAPTCRSDICKAYVDPLLQSMQESGSLGAISLGASV